MYNYISDSHKCVVNAHIQEEQNGLSGAVYSAINNRTDESILIILGDIICLSNLPNTDNNLISIQEVPDYNRWCMYDEKSHKFYDKPTTKPPTTSALSGVYFIKDSKQFNKSLAEQLSNSETKINNEFQISTSLQKLNKFNTFKAEIIDFGTLEEYLENRNVKTSRSFNRIIFDNGFATKFSTVEREKLIREYNWYNNLPDMIKIYTPRIFAKSFFTEEISYTMKKILAPSLREIYLFFDNSIETWDVIFTKLFNLLDLLSSKPFAQKNDFINSVYTKTRNRIKDIDIPINNKIVNNFLYRFEQYSNFPDKYSLMHGDYCFSNILYDFNDLVLIDPRGELFGSHYYDVAKLTHSVLFDYDIIDAELYIYENSLNYKIYNDGKYTIKNRYIEILTKRYTKQEIEFILYLTASLFLSMIPLHNHKEINQKLFYNKFLKINNILLNGDDILCKCLN